jgi:hypothetical protein
VNYSSSALRSVRLLSPSVWCEDEGRPSPTWRSFLRNQAAGIAAIDMFVVASASFRLLYVMIILPDDRRKIVLFDVTRYRTAGWLARQVTDAFPWDTSPRYLLRDHDASYGQDFRNQGDAMGITEVVTASRSPWQNAYVERMIGALAVSNGMDPASPSNGLEERDLHREKVGPASTAK